MLPWEWVLPSFLIILLVARCFEAFRNSRIVSGCMAGLKPAVIGLIGTAVLSVGKTVFFPQGFSTDVLGGMSFYISLAIFLLMTVLAFKKVHPILLICLSAVIGICAGYGWGCQCRCGYEKKPANRAKKSPRPHGLSDFCF